MEEERKSLPVQIVEIELSQPLPDLKAFDPERGIVYGQALLQVRLHTYPIGTIEQSFEQSNLVLAELYARDIWHELGEAINAHLREDGLPKINWLDASGLPTVQKPPCLVEREQFLAQAPRASVIVATHNRPDQLAVCLDSLLAMEYPRFDVIVVDNAPASDETQALIDSRYEPTGKVRYIREDVAGLARAHNCGLAETDAPYIAITDDDVTVDRYWLAELMRGFTRKKDVGCVTGSIFPAEIETQAQYWIERSAGFTKGYQRQVFNLTDHRPDHPLFPYAAGMFGSGANMAFDTVILRETGGFDDSLGAGSIALGGDDLASFFQIVAGGHTLVYEPAAMIYHTHYREYTRLRKTAYGYGAGLTAYLTKTLLDRPARLVEFVRRIPYGLFYALSNRSPKNTRKTEDYPGELNWLERKGMAAGPLLYLRSRRHINQLSGGQRLAVPVTGKGKNKPGGDPA